MRVWPLAPITLTSLCLLGCMGSTFGSPMIIAPGGIAIALGFVYAIYKLTD